jgi:hypothetical protein
LIRTWLRATLNLTYALEPEDPLLAFELSKEGLERAKRRGLTWAVRYQLGNAVDAAFVVGEWDWALGALADALDQDLEVRERLWFESLDVMFQAYRGELEPARTAAPRLAEMAQGFDDVQYLAFPYWVRLSVALNDADPSEAVILAEETLGHGHAMAEAAPIGARAALWIGDLDASRRLLDRYRAFARPGRRTSATAATIEAGILALEGRRSEARQAYADAQHRWRELRLPTWLALCQLDAIEVDALEPAERDRAGDEARVFFERVGARPMLARLEAALARRQAATAPAERTPSGSEVRLPSA